MKFCKVLSSKQNEFLRGFRIDQQMAPILADLGGTFKVIYEYVYS